MTSTSIRRSASAASTVLLAMAVACGGGQKNTAEPTLPPAEADPPVASAPTPPTPEPTPEVKPPPEPLPKMEEVPALVFPEEEFRKTQPKASKARNYKFPKVKRFKLRNGITVFLVEKHDLPVVSMEINMPGGSINDPVGKEGLASMCMSLVTDGTKTLDKIAFNEALADTASSVSAYAGAERQGLSMRTLSKHFESTFALFVDTLTEPGFREEDFKRKVRRSLARLRQTRASASSVSRRVVDRVLYGSAHPFGRIYTGKTLGALSVDDCKAYHASYIKPRGARLFVVGDVTAKQIKKAFAGPKLKAWKGAPKRSVKLGKPKTAKGKIFFVHVPGAAQSAIAVRHFGPKRKDRGYFANTMAGAILGGGFSGRVNMNLRENKGYSYGARANFGYSQKYGEMAAGSSVRSDSTYQSVIEIYNEMNDIATGKKKATKAELAREKNGAILGLPARFASARRALSQYRRLVYHKLPLNYYNTYVRKIRRVNLKQVNAAAKRHVKPNKAVYIVVGDADAVQKKHVPGSGPGVKGKDVPLLDEQGQPVTLLDSLRQLVAKGALGKGELIILTPDGNPKPN